MCKNVRFTRLDEMRPEDHFTDEEAKWMYEDGEASLLNTNRLVMLTHTGFIEDPETSVPISIREALISRRRILRMLERRPDLEYKQVGLLRNLCRSLKANVVVLRKYLADRVH